MITVVNIRSLSYSGTTWINTVLGSHEDAITIGPPDRIWNICKEKNENDIANACLVHNKKCEFWPNFIKEYDINKNFFEQLATFSGKKVIVLNNPSKNFIESEMSSDKIDIKFIKVIRDGRANIHSAMRHHPERHKNVFEAARDWYIPAIRRLDKQVSNEHFLLKYESLIFDFGETIKRLSSFIGIDYSINCRKYWEYDHHLVAGNTGMIDLLQKLQGLEGFEHKRSDFYQKALKDLSNDNEVPVYDTSWQQTFSREDIVAYDFLVGSIHEYFGFERDKVSANEVYDLLMNQLICLKDMQSKNGNDLNQLSFIQRIKYVLNGTKS